MSVSFGSGGYAGPKEVKYLFIDGGCLRTILADFSILYFGGNPIELDFQEFARPFTKTFYYDSLPPQKKDESPEIYKEKTKQIQTLFENLATLDNFHIYLGSGTYRRKTPGQKQVDIMIAIDMLKHTFNRNMHAATLLSSDSDFIPLLDALVESGMYVNLWFGNTINCRTNKDLLKAADARMKLNVRNIYYNTTRAFKEKFKIPIIMEHVHPTYTDLIKEWEDSLNGKIFLYKDNNQFVLIKRNSYNKMQTDSIRFNDLKVLNQFCKDEYNIEIPEV